MLAIAMHTLMTTIEEHVCASGHAVAVSSTQLQGAIENPTPLLAWVVSLCTEVYARHRATVQYVKGGGHRRL